MKLHTNIFGWDYVWREFAQSRGGEVVNEGNRTDGEVTALIVPSGSGEASVTFTPVPSGCTAVIHFQPVTDFMFSLYTERPLHQINKAFGMQDIVIGAKDFDAKFIIKSNQEAALRQIFLDASLRDLILNEETCDLRILTPDAGYDPRWIVAPGHSVVAFARASLMDKYEQLDNVYEILCRIAGHMERLRLGHTNRSIVLEPEAESANKPVSGKLHSPLLDRN